MSVKAKKVIEAMKEAFDIFDKMELPIKERECTITYDAAKAIIDGFNQLERERDAAVQDISIGRCCITCNNDNDFRCIHCNEIVEYENWEWRGPQK